MGTIVSPFGQMVSESAGGCLVWSAYLEGGGFCIGTKGGETVLPLHQKKRFIKAPLREERTWSWTSLLRGSLLTGLPMTAVARRMGGRRTAGICILARWSAGLIVIGEVVRERIGS